MATVTFDATVLCSSTISANFDSFAPRAGSNLITNSNTFNLATLDLTKQSANIPDPFGGNTAYKFTVGTMSNAVQELHHW